MFGNCCLGYRGPVQCRSVRAWHPWFGLDPFTGANGTRYLTETYDYTTTGPWLGPDVGNVTAAAHVTVVTSRYTGEQISLVALLNGVEHYRYTIDPSTGAETTTMSDCWHYGGNDPYCPADPYPNACSNLDWVALALVVRDFGATNRCLVIPPSGASFATPVNSGGGLIQTIAWTWNDMAGRHYTGSTTLTLSQSYDYGTWIADILALLAVVGLDDATHIYAMDDLGGSDPLRPHGMHNATLSYTDAADTYSSVTMYYGYATGGNTNTANGQPANIVPRNLAGDAAALAFIENPGGNSQSGKMRCQYPMGASAWNCILMQTQNLDGTWNDCQCVKYHHNGPIEYDFTPGYAGLTEQMPGFPGVGLGRININNLPGCSGGILPCCDPAFTPPAPSASASSGSAGTGGAAPGAGGSMGADSGSAGTGSGSADQ